MSKPMSTIEALEGAIQMLRAMKDGKSWNVFEYIDRLHAFERARDAHHAAQAEAERQQHEIRTLSAAVRNTRQKSHPASIDQGFAPAAPDRGPMLPPGGQPNREQP